MKDSRVPIIKMIMMPKDTNPLGSIFGGYILSLIDQAAGEQARIEAAKKYVTKVMREVEFHAPVYVGDLISLYSETVAVGTTSVTVKVDVVAQRGRDRTVFDRVTSAEVVMVAVDEHGRPIAVR
jgi:acyl-CoA thioesterase YciA